MKKFLLLMLAASSMLVSCSSDSDGIAGNDGRKYPVKFNVSSFGVETSPLSPKATRVETTLTGNRCLQYVVYDKDNGNVILSDTIQNQAVSLHSRIIEADLPIGDYQLAVVFGVHQFEGFDFKFFYSAENFNTDFCTGNDANYGSKDNKDMYYETAPFSVKGEGTLVNITLQPMWSVMTVKVGEESLINIPDGTTFVHLKQDPHTYGFGIKDKKAKVFEKKGEIQFSVTEYKVAQFISELGFSNTTKTTTQAADDRAVRLVFLKKDSKQNPIELAVQTIYQGPVTPGVRMKFSGAIGGFDGEGDIVDFGLTFEDFVDMEFPFIEKEKK